jgi:hypothetical protein
VRSGEIDYVTYHDDVVDTVAVERSTSLSSGQSLIKTNQIDLGVEKGGRLVELYEIKTGSDPQSLYTAVGQLLTHSAKEDRPVRLVMVVPRSPSPSEDMKIAMRKHAIGIRTFTINRAGARTRVMLDSPFTRTR